MAAGEHALVTGQYGRARQWYERAYELDVDNKEAAAGLIRLQQRGFADGQAAATVRWTDVLMRLALLFLAVLLLLILIARLVTGLCAGPDSQSQRLSRWKSVVGLAAAAIGSAGVAWVGAGYTSELGALITLLPAVCCGLVGAVVLGYWLGHRLSVQVEVRSDRDTVDGQRTAYLVSRLAAMGSNPPRGLLIPRGTDVAALPDDALSVLPQGRLVEALLKVARALLPLAPWRAAVTVGADGSASVEMRRNGRIAATVLIRPSDLVAAAPNPESVRDVPLAAAAAVVLMTLAKVHPELRVGMCGATRWRGLARQVLASEPPYSEDLAVRARMLAEAIEDDPNNRLAWYGYLIAKSLHEPMSVGYHRGFATRVDALYTTLSSTELQDNGYTALRIRILYASTAGWLNHADTLPTTERDQHAAAFSHAAVSADAMYELAKAASVDDTTEPLRQFACDVLPLAETLRTTVTGADRLGRTEPWLDPQDAYLGDLIGQALRTIYIKACQAARGGKPDQAVAALGLAIGLPRQRHGAWTDPALCGIAAEPQFIELMTGQQPIARLHDFAKYEPALARQKIYIPGDLLARPAIDDAALAAQLNIPPSEIERLRQVCILAVTCPEAQYAAAWVNLLHCTGIDDPATLHKHLNEAGGLQQLHGILSALAVRRQIHPPGLDRLKAWATTKPTESTSGQHSKQ